MDGQVPRGGSNEKPKIVIITRILRSYHFPIYDSISKIFDISTFVLEEFPKDSEWIANEGDSSGLDVRYMSSIRFGRFCSDALSIPSAPVGIKAVLAALRGKWDCVVVDGFETGAPFMYSIFRELGSVPFVLVCASTIDCEAQTHVPFLRIAKGMVIKRADACLCYGSESRRFVMSFGKHPRHIFAPCFTYSHPPGIEKSIERRGAEDVRSRLGLKKDAPVLLYVGQFLRRKNLPVLMEAFARARKSIPNAQFLLVGKGPEKPKLKRLASEFGLGEAVKFCPPMEWESVWQAYAAADALALVSTKDAWGQVINEAMLAGLPVLSSTGCGATYDLVRHGTTGFVVKPYQVGLMAKYIEALLLRKHLRQEMGRNAARVISEWTLQQQVASFALAVREALKRNIR